MGGQISKMASVYNIIEKVAKTGKIDKGVNEVTKAVERGVARLVVIAKDVEPKELLQHIPIICKEKNIKLIEADSKQKLGISAGINVSCSAIAVIEPGEAQKDIASL